MTVTEPPVTVTAAPPATASPSSASPTLSSEPTPTESFFTEDPSTGPSSTSTDGPVVVPAEKSGVPLGLDDVFAANPEDAWQERRFTVAGRADVRGMGVAVNSYGGDPAQLELRLGNRFSSLTMKVGQDDNSPSSDRGLAVEVRANGKQRDARVVPFNETRSFTVDVTDVNALQVLFQLQESEDASSEDEVIAVVEDLTVTTEPEVGK